MGKFNIRGPIQLGTSVVFLHEGSDVMEIRDEQNNRLGIQFNADGTFSVGGWSESGEWVDLVVRETLPANLPNGDTVTVPFALDQYRPDEEEVEVD